MKGWYKRCPLTSESDIRRAEIAYHIDTGNSSQHGMIANLYGKAVLRFMSYCLTVGGYGGDVTGGKIVFLE